MKTEDNDAAAKHTGDLPDRVCLGRIGGAHGVRGAVRIETFTREPEDIQAYGPLQSENGERCFRVTVQRRAKSGVIARVDGISSRDAAAELKGIRLFVPRDVLPAPDDDEFYHADLIGLEAVTLDGVALGRVITVENFGAGDVIEIKSANSHKTILLPFNRETVPTVDLDQGLVKVDVPDSLRGDLD